MLTPGVKSNLRLEPRYPMLQPRQLRKRTVQEYRRPVGEAHITHDAIDTVPVRMEFVIAEIMPRDEEDDHTGADADRKTQHVYRREQRMTEHLPPREPQVIFYHGEGVYLNFRHS